MSLLVIGSWLSIALTYAVGIGGLFATTKMADTQNIKVGGPLALGELRTALGSNFVVLATALVYFRSAELFLVLTALWAAATTVKIISFFTERPPFGQAIVGIIVDVVMGLLALCGYLAYRI